MSESFDCTYSTDDSQWVYRTWFKSTHDSKWISEIWFKLTHDSKSFQNFDSNQITTQKSFQNLDPNEFMTQWRYFFPVLYDHFWAFNFTADVVDFWAFHLIVNFVPVTSFRASDSSAFFDELIWISSWLKQYFGDLNRFNPWLKRRLQELAQNLLMTQVNSLVLIQIDSWLKRKMWFWVD